MCAEQQAQMQKGVQISASMPLLKWVAFKVETISLFCSIVPELASLHGYTAKKRI